MQTNLKGVWLSSRTYTSALDGKRYRCEHYLAAHITNDYVIFESPTQDTGYMILRLAIDDHVLTGTFQETTVIDGPYGGEVYHGALQLLPQESGERYEGQWVGYNKSGKVQHGPWSLTYIGKDLNNSSPKLRNTEPVPHEDNDTPLEPNEGTPVTVVLPDV